MKYTVNVFEKNGIYIAKCKDLNLQATGKSLTEVKQKFVIQLTEYIKDKHTFIDFVWELNIDN